MDRENEVRIRYLLYLWVLVEGKVEWPLMIDARPILNTRNFLAFKIVALSRQKINLTL